MAERPAGSPRRRLLRHLISAALIALAAYFLWRTAWDAGWDALRTRIAAAEPALVALALLVTLARYGAWTARWQLLARPVDAFPWWPGVRALMASLFVTTVVPGSRAFGGLIRSRHLARERGRPTSRIYGTALVDQFGYSVVSMTMGALFLPVAFWGGPSGDPRGRYWLYAAGALMAVAFGLAWWWREAILGRMRRRIPGFAEAVEEVIGAARELLGRPGSWLIMAVGGAAVYSANIITLQIAAAALGWQMSFAVAAGAFSVGSLAGTVVNTPGGVGTTEAAATLFLQKAVGLPPDVALASVFLARGLHYVLSLALGGIAVAGARDLRV